MDIYREIIRLLPKVMAEKSVTIALPLTPGVREYQNGFFDRPHLLTIELIEFNPFTLRFSGHAEERMIRALENSTRNRLEMAGFDNVKIEVDTNNIN
jgi:hypothetical protein